MFQVVTLVSYYFFASKKGELSPKMLMILLSLQAVLEFFRKFMDSVGPELEFKVEDITTGDPNAAGVIWHLGQCTAL